MINENIFGEFFRLTEIPRLYKILLIGQYPVMNYVTNLFGTNHDLLRNAKVTIGIKLYVSLA